MLPSSVRSTQLLPLLVALLAGAYWTGAKVLPALMWVCFALACVLYWMAGSIASHYVEARASTAAPAVHVAGPFQKLWLGQFFVFGLIVAATPLVALSYRLTSLHLSLRWWLPFVVVVWFMRIRSRNRAAAVASSSLTPAFWLVAGLLGMCAMRGLSMHANHAGALGHDTQQHIFWTQHILDYGYLPLTARDSDLLEHYPKFFHVLAASWAALGFTDIVGPFVKIMPFLQTLIVIGFATELLLLPKREDDAASASFGAILVALCATWHLTYGAGQRIYPHVDLSGTPRYASTWLLTAPMILVLAERTNALPNARTWLLASLPPVAVLAAGFNPVAPLLLFTYSVPSACILWLVMRGEPRTRAANLRALVLGCGTALLLCLFHPWAVSTLASLKSGASLLSTLGIRLDERGVDAPALPSSIPPLCNSQLGQCLREILGLSFEAISERAQLGSARLLGNAPPLKWYALACSVPLLVSAMRSPMRRWVPRGRTFVALLLAGLLPALSVHAAAEEVLHRLARGGFMWWLLWQYYLPLSMFFLPWFLGVLPISLWTGVAEWTRSLRALQGTLALALIAEFLALNAFEIPDLKAHRYMHQSIRLDWPRLRMMEHLNHFVPEEEAVLLPARYVHLSSGEDLLVNDSEVGALLGNLKTKLLFALSLGSGVDYGWPDLVHSFCADRQSRQRLLREAKVHWVLVRALPSVPDEKLLDKRLWGCDVTLRNLGAAEKASWREQDLRLYRVSP